MPRKVFRLSDSLGSMTLDAQQHEIAHLQAANRELKEAVRSLSSGQVAHTLMAEDLDAAKAEVARLEDLRRMEERNTEKAISIIGERDRRIGVLEAFVRADDAYEKMEPANRDEDDGWTEEELAVLNDLWKTRDAAKAEVARLEGRVRELEVERDSLRTYYESTAPFLRRLRRPRYDVDETDEYVNGSTECKRAIVALGEIVAAVGPLPPAEGEEPT